MKVTSKVKTCRQTKEEAGDARSDNETVARGTQDGRFTENLVNISLTLARVSWTDRKHCSWSKRSLPSGVHPAEDEPTGGTKS